MFRYPVSLRSVPGTRHTEVACHVHRVSLVVDTAAPDYATKVVEFMDRHRECSTTMDLSRDAPGIETAAPDAPAEAPPPRRASG